MLLLKSALVVWLIASTATPAEAIRLFTAGHIGSLASANQSEWFYTGGTPTQETTIVKTGERYSLEVSSLSSGTRKQVGHRILASGMVNGDDYFVVFPFHVVTRPSAQNMVFAGVATNPTPSEVDVRLKSTGELEIRESSTVIATSAVLSLNTWYCVGVRVRRVDGAGSDQVELQLDGASVGSSSALTITSTNAMREIMIGGNLGTEAQTTGEWYFGSVRVNDSTGSSDTSWPSCDNRVNYLFPDGAGTFSEPTESGAATDWEAVDDTAPDGATTHTAFTGTSANWGAGTARLLMTATSAAAAGIGAEDTIYLAAIGWIYAAPAGTATELVMGVRSGGSNADMTTAGANSKSSTGYHFIDDAAGTVRYDVRYVNPVTTSAWTVSELDAVEIGARGPDADDANLTTLWMLVEYDDNAAGAAGTNQSLVLLGVGE